MENVCVFHISWEFTDLKSQGLSYMKRRRNGDEDEYPLNVKTERETKKD